MSLSRPCPYSGRAVLLCKASDLCDCFDFPEVDEQAAEVAADRDRRHA